MIYGVTTNFEDKTMDVVCEIFECERTTPEAPSASRAQVASSKRCIWSMRAGAAVSSEQPKPPERLLNRRDLFWRARILFGRGSGCGEAEQLLAVQQPYALGHEAMLARDPLLDFLIRGTWTDRLLIGAITLRTPVSPIVIRSAHSCGACNPS